MTTPDLNLYPDEWHRLTTAKERLAAQFEFTHMTETNKRIFDMAAHSEFGDAGFLIEIDWQEICEGEQQTPTGVWLPHIAVTGRNKAESEHDHDRTKWGVVHGLADGQPGFIRADGSLREDPIRKDIF